jgi:pimeloyl-ACP methyl ester carboxylesterase
VTVRWRLAIVLLTFVSVAASAEPTRGYAVVNGTRLYYETIGTGSPLVLISGGGTLDHRQWDEQFDVLAERFQVIRYDIRGLGLSSRPTAPFSHTDDLRGLLRFLKIRRAALCGTSFGAAIALDFALDHPDSVSHLVLAGAGVSSDKESSVAAVQALAALAKAEGLDRAIDSITSLPSFITPTNTMARLRITQMYRDNGDVFDAGFPLVTLWQPAKPAASTRLATVKAETLLIVGERDSADSRSTVDRLAADIPHAQKKVIAGAAHMVNMDAPAAFTRAVLEFLLPPK